MSDGYRLRIGGRRAGSNFQRYRGGSAGDGSVVYREGEAIGALEAAVRCVGDRTRSGIQPGELAVRRLRSNGKLEFQRRVVIVRARKSDSGRGTEKYQNCLWVGNRVCGKQVGAITICSTHNLTGIVNAECIL